MLPVALFTPPRLVKSPAQRFFFKRQHHENVKDLRHSLAVIGPEDQAIVPDVGDKVDYDVGLSHRDVRVHRLAGLHDSPMP
jgi:hypothetical protein